MANCKECYHTEVCERHNRMVQIDEHTWDEYALLDDVENFCNNFKSNAAIAELKHVELRTEITTEDFDDKDLAKKRGWYRKKFYCPECGLLIKIETWEKNHMFGKSTVLKTNETPCFCPHCGAKMDGKEDA